jgi:lipopolysaccharide export system ATP-binding protein
MSVAAPAPAEGLRLVGVSKRYGARQALDGVSLTVHPGEIVALLGPNGSGKSTIYNILTGLERADRGQVLVDGVEVTDLPAFGRARLGISYLPQEPSSFRGLSVRDSLRLVLEWQVRDVTLREERVADLLRRFDLAGVADRKPAALSGGQRRRCETARALATKPRYLLVDEPFAKLDPIRIAALVSELRALVCGKGETAPGILITDHNIRAALGLAHRAVILVSGVVVATGAADRILDDPAIRNAILSPDTVY